MNIIQNLCILLLIKGKKRKWFKINLKRNLKCKDSSLKLNKNNSKNILKIYKLKNNKKLWKKFKKVNLKIKHWNKINLKITK